MDGANSLKCKLAVGGGIVAFLAILFVACMVGSIHTIQEGSVGIYYVQGRALPDRTLKFAGHVQPDRTKSGLNFFFSSIISFFCVNF